MPLKILMTIVAAIAANWFLFEQPFLTRTAVGIVAALFVALAYDCWAARYRKKP